jgi:hypothetical protein
VLLNIFTLFHVVISLIGIASGFIVVFGLIASRRLDGWTGTFLATTAATSLTGFLFPVQHFMPSHAVGILSLVVLALAVWGLYKRQLAAGWRSTYAITSVIALYFNVFVLVVQLFNKVPALKALAPTQSEPPFAAAQLSVLVLFVVLGVLATVKFRRASLQTA